METESLWLKQEISKHPKFPNFKRFVNVRNVALQAQYKQIIIEAHLTYTDEDDGADVTGLMKSEIGNWNINNYDTTTVRDKISNPVPNPDYVSPEETPDIEPYQKKPSFDYFEIVIKTSGLDLIELLSMHVTLDDALGRFNF